MASGRDIFIINRTYLAELRDGQLIKSDIEMPAGLWFLNLSLDCKTIAYCKDGDSYLIYELVDRQFMLKHKFSKFLLGIPKSVINLKHCQYVQNILITKITTGEGLNIYDVIDLEANNTILMCYGTYVYYCDGIISIAPAGVKYNKRYNNINLSDKTITHDCPYFMKTVEQVIINSTGSLKFGNGFTIIKDREVYITLTETLLCVGNVDTAAKYYGNYFINFSQLIISQGAPVAEYTCTYNKTIYVYVVKSGGHATKAAIQSGDANN